MRNVRLMIDIHLDTSGKGIGLQLGRPQLSIKTADFFEYLEPQFSSSYAFLKLSSVLKLVTDLPNDNGSSS